MTTANARLSLRHRLIAASQTPAAQAVGLILSLYLLGYLF